MGTATLSDSANMQKWENDMVKLGPEGVGDNPDGWPRGYQAMSALMRFDDDFLNSYGNSLVEYDKAHNSENPNYWINNWDDADLNFYGKGDRGRDPMSGFLEALGTTRTRPRSSSGRPAATPTGAVTGDGQLNDHLKYLVKERHWWSDDPQEPHGYMAGQDALGHALQAATTGYSYDNPHPGADHRNATTAGVMEQVAYLYGGEDGPKRCCCTTTRNSVTAWARWPPPTSTTSTTTCPVSVITAPTQEAFPLRTRVVPTSATRVPSTS